MILDSLTHITPDGRWFGQECDASEERLLRELEAARVDRAVVVALAGYISNEFVLEVCRRHPDRLIPGASFNPAGFATEKQAVAEFRSQLHESPFKVLKLHPRFNRYDPLDPRCLAVLEEVASWRVPLPIWMDSLFYFQGGVLRRSVVDTIHEIVGRFPSLDFVILHSGGPWALHVADAIRDCPNGFLDLSFILSRYRGSSLWSDLRYLLDTFDRRMVFGSDFPEVGIGESLGCFRDMAGKISPDKCDNVLGINLSAILSRE